MISVRGINQGYYSENTSQSTCVHAGFEKCFDRLGRVTVLHLDVLLQQLLQFGVQLFPQYFESVIAASVPGYGEVLLPVSLIVKVRVRSEPNLVTDHRRIHRNHRRGQCQSSYSSASCKRKIQAFIEKSEKKKKYRVLDISMTI